MTIAEQRSDSWLNMFRRFLMDRNPPLKRRIAVERARVATEREATLVKLCGEETTLRIERIVSASRREGSC